MPSSSLRIVITAYGSLGDLLPYIGLGRALQARGHAPVIAVSEAYADIIAKAGLESFPVRPNVEPNHAATVSKVMEPIHGFGYLLREYILPFVRESYDDLVAATENADVLVSHYLTFSAPYVAQRRKLAWASTVLSPWGLLSRDDPSPVVAHPKAYALLRRAPRLHRAAVGLYRARMRRWTEPLDRIARSEGLRLREDPLLLGQFSEDLVLGLFASTLAKPQHDWPANTHVTGAVTHDVDEGELSEEMRAFLDAGDPPIVFTLGSAATMATKATDFYAIGAAAARRLGRRSVLLTGSSEFDASRVSGDKDCLAVRWASHLALFRRAAAVVHQGGAGTLHATLVAGRPMVIVPFAFDQCDHGMRAERLGIGRMVFPTEYDETGLAAALRPLLEDRHVGARAEQNAKLIAADRGATAACERIEALAARRSLNARA